MRTVQDRKLLMPVLILSMAVSILTTSIPLQAQLANAQQTVYQAYLDGDPSQWENGLQLWDTYQRSRTLTDKELYDLALAKYGLAGLYMAKEDKDRVATLLDETEVIAERLLKSRQFSVHAKALMGGLYGLKIGLSPAKAIFLGPKSLSYLKEALEEGPMVPAAWVEMGNAKYHSPALFGGSNDEAINCFQQAVKLYDQKMTEKQYCWMYLHSLSWLGQAYERDNDIPKARATYQKALRAAPGFRWIRDELILNLN